MGAAWQRSALGEGHSRWKEVDSGDDNRKRIVVSEGMSCEVQMYTTAHRVKSLKLQTSKPMMSLPN